MRQDSAGIGAVQDRQIEIAVPNAKGLAEDLRGPAGAAHAEQESVRVARLPDVVGQRLQAGNVLLHRTGDVQPAQPIGDLLHRGLRHPDGGIVLPDAVEDVVSRHLTQGASDRLLIGPLDQPGLHALPADRQPLDLLLDALHQIGEGFGELVDPLLQKIVGDLIQVDPQLRQFVQLSLRRCQLGLQGERR